MAKSYTGQHISKNAVTTGKGRADKFNVPNFITNRPIQENFEELSLQLDETFKNTDKLTARVNVAERYLVPTGSIVMWGTATAPEGWMICNGTAISRTTFGKLFAVIGTTFGTGDGSTTFNIPDFRQRFPIGVAASGTGSTLGGTGGTIDHTHGDGTLSVASHTHSDGTLTVASHTHGDGTLTVASHTHGAGSYAAASHSHGDGSLAVASHSHDDGTLAVASHSHGAGSYQSTAHGHNITFSTAEIEEGTSGIFTEVVIDVTSPSANAGGGFLSGGSSNAASPDVTGSTGSESPDVTGSTGSTAPSVTGTSGAASPTVNGTTGATAPDVTGATGAATPDVTGATGANNPPFLAINFIIKI